MEKETISPNFMTFSILYEFLADRNEFSIIKSTLQHAIKHGILPDRRSSTKLVKALRMGNNSSNSNHNHNRSSRQSDTSNLENKNSTVVDSDLIHEDLIKTVSQLADIRIQEVLGNPVSAHVFPDKRQSESRRIPLSARKHAVNEAMPGASVDSGGSSSDITKMVAGDLFLNYSNKTIC